MTNTLSSVVSKYLDMVLAWKTKHKFTTRLLKYQTYVTNLQKPLLDNGSHIQETEHYHKQICELVYP